MSLEQNKATARRFFEGFNGGDLSKADEYISRDFHGTGPGTPQIPPGPDGYRQLVSTYRTGFPDLHISTEEMVAEGDSVAVSWKARGTQNGELLGIPPTGKVGTATGMHFFHLTGGKISEARVDWDMLGTLQQLGVVTMPGQSQRRAA